MRGEREERGVRGEREERGVRGERGERGGREEGIGCRREGAAGRGRWVGVGAAVKRSAADSGGEG